MSGTMLFLSMLAGLAAGLLFFGGLWVTLLHVPRSAAPARLLLASWVIRMAMLVVVIRMLIADGHWECGLAGLVGVLAARTILIRTLGTGAPRMVEAREP
ncbi:MAG: ATP synthase subunit I [Planctomycetota bacterium]